MQTMVRGLVVVVLVLASCSSESGTDRGEPRVEPVSHDLPARLDPNAELAIVAALSERYERCVLALGFDPGGVQVVLADGRPSWVKTGRSVPAAIHSPCLVDIGGSATTRASWG